MGTLVSFPQLCCDSSQVTLHHSTFSRYFDTGNCMAFPTIRNRGHGYSNRFTLCRGCTLVPQHLISSVGISPNHRNTVRGSSTITFHLRILVWAPLPMSLASQWRPTVNLGTAQGLGRTFTSFRIISYRFFCGRGSFRHNPDDACLEGTHTKTHKLPVKPYPDSGIVGVLVKLEWYRIRTQPSVFL